MFSVFGATVIQWPWCSRISKPSFSVYHFADFFASDTTRAIVVRRIMGTGLIPADKGHGPPPRRNAHRLAPDGRWHDPIAARARKNGDRPAPTARRAQLVGRRPLRIRLSWRGSSSLGHRPGPLGPVRKDRAPDAHAKRRTRIPPTADAGRDDPPRKICLDFPPQPRPHATHRAAREGVTNEGQSRRSL